jgi:membrane-associated protein
LIFCPALRQAPPRIRSDVRAWVYGFLFGIVFAETGLVVTPFLPGDSLLFAAGALSAQPGGGLNPWLLFIMLATAAFTGNA